MAGKLQSAAVKTNKRAMAYLALAFDNMKLLRFVTKAKSDDWPEGEAWRVMQLLKKKYCPDGTPVRVVLRKMIVKEEATEERKEAATEERKEAATEERKEAAAEECEEAEDEAVESNAEKDVAEEELNDLHAEEEVCNEDDESEETEREEDEKIAAEQGLNDQS